MNSELIQMQTQLSLPSRQRAARLGGVFYLLIIALGLTGELVLRGPILAAGPDALIVSVVALRLSIILDVMMVAADVVLALLLALVLVNLGVLLTVLATLFRLIQATLIAGGLLLLQEATLLIDAQTGDAGQNSSEPFFALVRHGHGYDLGLFFFGISSVLIGILLRRTSDVPRWLGPLMMAAGGVYLIGSTLRILAPEQYSVFQPAYLIAIIAELSFAITLLRWPGETADGRSDSKEVLVGDEGFEPPTSSM